MSRITRFILMAVILAGVGWYVWTARQTLEKQLLGFDPRYAAGMLAVPLAMLGINGLIGRDLAAEFGVRLTMGEWYGLATVNALGNYLPLPQAGALARGVYLKKIHGLSYSAYAASLIVTYVSSLALTGLIGLGALAVLAWRYGSTAPWVLWAAFSVLAGSAVLFTPAAQWIPLPRRLAGFGEGLRKLRHHHILARIVLLQLILIGLAATGLWLACHAQPGGGMVSWPIALVLGLMMTASGVVNVTPGNLGVEQGAAEIAARLMRLPGGVGFAASTLFRAFAVVVVLAIGPIWSAWLTKRRAVVVEGGRMGGEAEEKMVGEYTHPTKARG